jgi:PilZ domain
MTQAYIRNKTERRGYFRIDDVALLHFKMIDGDGKNDVVQSDSLMLNKLTLKAKFDTISRRLHPFREIISASSPDIAQYLSALEKQLDILAEYLIDTEMSDMEISPQEVNIGAGGVAFLSSNPVPSRSLLELRIVLLPENTGIFCYARVVSCALVSEDGLNGYKIAVKFEHMEDEVRDSICSHVLAVERESINSR